MSPRIDLETAAGFVHAHGDAVALARLSYRLRQEPPPAAAVAALFAAQQEDGGLAPFWAPDSSAVDATCYGLAVAVELGLDDAHPAVADALRFLLWRQETDGRFGEDPDLTDSAPPWALPGDPAATLYLTANAGFWLAQSAVGAAAAARAAGFLAGHLESGRLPSFLQTGWLAGGLWWRLGQTEPATAVFAHLLARLADLDAADLAWLLQTVSLAGVPRTAPLPSAAAARLAGLQTTAGHFGGPAEERVAITLTALSSLA